MTLLLQSEDEEETSLDWLTKLTGFLGVIGFVEAGLVLLLDRSMALPLLVLDLGFLVLGVILWAPLVTKGRAQSITIREIKTRYPKAAGVRIEEERTRLKDGQRYVSGYVRIITPHSDGEALCEVVLDSRCGTVDSRKSKFPNIPWN
jgi:hypothetical protein